MSETEARTVHPRHRVTQGSVAQARHRSGRRVSAATKWAARVLLLAFLVALVAVVFLPAEDHQALGLVARVARRLSEWASLPLRPVFMLVEFGANIALFVPLGVLLPLAIGSLKPWVYLCTPVVGLLMSGTIELVQTGIPGRVSDPRDLVSNTLGALLGVLLLFLLVRFRERRECACR